MRRIRHALQWFGMILSVAPVCAAGKADKRDLGAEALDAIQFFAQRDLASVQALQRIRSPRLPPEIRAAVLQSLPPEGALKPKAGEQRKLAGIDALLGLHDRTGAIEVKVIDTFQAAVALHARSVLLISRPALNVLTPEEVQALAAHEIGHDYFWDEYEQAIARAQRKVIRELELRCDGIALLALRVLKVDPRALATAIRKLDKFNARFGVPLNVDRYVSEAERFRFQRAFLLFADAGRNE